MAAIAAAVLVTGACTVQKKVSALRTGKVTADIVLPKEPAETNKTVFDIQ